MTQPKKQRGTAQLLMEDFSKQCFQVEEGTRERIVRRPAVFYSLLFADWFICELLIGPLTVAFWRGTWDYSNVYLDKVWCGGDLALSNSLAAAAGFLATFSIDTFHHEFGKFAGRQGTFKHKMCNMIFSVFWGFFDIM